MARSLGAVTGALTMDERGYKDASAIVRAFIQEKTINPHRTVPRDVVAEIVAEDGRVSGALWELGQLAAHQVLRNIAQGRQDGRFPDGMTDEEAFDLMRLVFGAD
jgi:hypothetical protein